MAAALLSALLLCSLPFLRPSFTAAHADTAALLAALGDGLDEINTSARALESRAVAATVAIQQSIFACEEKQAHLENVWQNATMQLQRVRTKQHSAMLLSHSVLLLSTAFSRTRFLHHSPLAGACWGAGGGAAAWGWCTIRRR